MPPNEGELPWDFTNEELASIASDELHAHRPNRWTGAKSSWRELTRQDREIWETVKHGRSEDLSIHLYNAHALKRDANATKARVRMLYGKATQNSLLIPLQMQYQTKEKFIPRKHWTAWPLHPATIPRERLLKRTLDKYERYTMRKPQRNADPRETFADAYSAVVLRLAHHNFQKQLARRAKKDATGKGKDVDIRPSVEEADEIISIDDEDEDVLGAESSTAGSSRQRRRKAKETPFVPIMSADDDASYKGLRPAARQFMSQLDTTLDILHERLPKTRSWKRRSASEKQRSTSRTRGRPRVAPNTLPAGRQPKGTAKGRGRPKNVHLPLEGETRQEMLVRIARQSHRRIPYTEEERRAAAIDLTAAAESEPPEPEPDNIEDEGADSDTDTESSETGDMDQSEEESDVDAADSDEDMDANQNSDMSEDEEEDSDLQSSQGEVSEPNQPKKETKKQLDRRFRRLVLRDWRDVLSAASRAGFPPEVLRRTADRCATLFNESTTLVLRDDEVDISRTGTKQPLQAGQPSKSTVHQPSSHFLPKPEYSSSSEGERAEALRMEQLLNRYSGTPSSGDRSSSRGRASSRGRSTSRASSEAPGRSSRSRSASINVCYCPVQSCPRSLRPFDRKSNFRRHMSKVHPGVDPEVIEQDSADELHDGVHVDGFMKQIKVRRYRGRDLAKRKVKIDEPSQSNRSSPRKRRASTDEDFE